MEEVNEKPRSNLFKDYGYYTLWICVWLGIFGTFQLVGSGSSFGVAASLAFFYAFLIALLFTIFQNTINTSRKKWVSWVAFIVIWNVVKFGSIGLSMLAA